MRMKVMILPSKLLWSQMPPLRQGRGGNAAGELCKYSIAKER